MRMAWLAKYRESGLLLIRLGLGVLFAILAGPVLLGGPNAWAHSGDAVRQFGLRTHHQFWGFIGALAGCLGGTLMIFGLFFRPGVLLVLVLTVIHALDANGSWRANLAAVELSVVLVGLLFVGPGKYSVDKT